MEGGGRGPNLVAKQVLLGYKPLPALIAEKLPRWCPGGDVLSLGRAPGSQDMHRAPGTQAISPTGCGVCKMDSQDSPRGGLPLWSLCRRSLSTGPSGGEGQPARA